MSDEAAPTPEEDLGQAEANEAAATGDRIEKGAYETIGGHEAIKDDVVEGFTDLMNKQSQMLDLFIFIGVAIAAAVLLNTLLMNLAERDSDLATLRVLGASRRRLGLMLLGEHIAIGLVGGILGAIMAIYGAVAFAKAFSQWAFYFVIEVDPYVASGLVAVVVAISVAITPIGIWRIHRMDLVDMAKGFSS